MAQKITQGDAYRVVLDTTPNDLIGIASTLFVSVTPPGSAVATKDATSFSEITEAAPTAALSTVTPGAAAPAGSTVISVDATQTLDASMVGCSYEFITSTLTFFARIIAVDPAGYTMTLAAPTPAAIATTDNISYYGGTGVYSADIALPDLGTYVLTARASDNSVSVGATSVEVVAPTSGALTSETVYARLVG